MMSLSSSQAGIVAARRNKINQTKFNLYRDVIVEYDDQYYFQNTPPGTKGSFTARHIYNYNKNNNTFTFLGTQKAQSLIRKKNWASQLVFAGSNPSILDGTYTRSNVNSTVYWKNGIPFTEPFIEYDASNLWILYYNQGAAGSVSAVLDSNNNSWQIVASYVDTINNPTPTLTTSTTIDNTSLNNINNNRLYTNINPDLSRLQLRPDINFDINTANIFDTKNLANNQKVFIDIRWVGFVDDRRKGYTNGPEDAFNMNNRKGKMYRAGILIKDNTIDSMLYYTELIANSQIIKSMQQRKSFTSINI